MAANGIARYILGGSFPLFTVQSKLIFISFSFYKKVFGMLKLPIVDSVQEIGHRLGHQSFGLCLSGTPSSSVDVLQIWQYDSKKERLSSGLPLSCGALHISV